jgi:hypothetical protein
LRVCHKNISKINSKKHANKLFSLSSPKTKTQKITLIADSGATDLFVTQKDAAIILDDLTKCNDFEVLLPNGDIISAIEEGTLTLSSDPIVQVTGYVFKDADLKQSLLGLSPLTNEADCQITMDKNELLITKNNKIIARTGKRVSDQLWSLEVCRQKKEAQANLSIRLESDAEYAAFAHEAFGSPAVSTFYNAVSKGYLGNYPRLTAQMISANRPNTVATAKGHLDQTRKGMWSTKARVSVANVKVKEAEVVVVEKNTDMDGSTEDLTDIEDIAPEEEASEVVFTKLIDVDHECHSDGTGRNPTESREGNKYVLVSVYDNYIKLQAYPDKSAEGYVHTYGKLLDFLEDKKKKVSVQRLDNEKSAKLEELFAENQRHFHTYLRTIIVSYAQKEQSDLPRIISSPRCAQPTTTFLRTCGTNSWTKPS